jgi:hypothetical protein
LIATTPTPITLFLNKESIHTRMSSGINSQAAASQKSRAEQETETEANRLSEQVQDALALITMHSPDDADSLLAAAGRIERAARDLADAIRELARQRKSEGEES